MQTAKIIDEALDRATAGETLNEVGTRLLQSWLLNPRNDKSPDRPFVQQAVNRFYQALPGGQEEVRDCVFVSPGVRSDLSADAPVHNSLLSQGSR